MFTCTAPITDGTFTVPPEVVAQMPSSTDGWLTLIATHGTGLALGESFEAPRNDGSIISGRFIFTMASRALVEFE
jgi:hypothetical protein